MEVLNRKLGNERDKLQQLFEQAPGFMAVMRVRSTFLNCAIKVTFVLSDSETS